MNRRGFFAGLAAMVAGLFGWKAKVPARKTMLAFPSAREPVWLADSNWFPGHAKLVKHLEERRAWREKAMNDYMAERYQS